MWGIDPKRMCQKHLCGEHVEMHMLAGSILRNRSLGRFLTNGLVCLEMLEERHAVLAEEMQRRGYRHTSPLPPMPPGISGGWIDITANHRDLTARCSRCAAL